MSLTKLSITIETSVRDKLPKENKSAFINQILKQHFLKENVDGLYNYIKNRMIKEGLISDGSVSFESIATGTYQPQTSKASDDPELENYRTNYKDDGLEFERRNGVIQVRKIGTKVWAGLEVLNY